MIMVDQVIVWPGAKPPFHNGSCHLTTDGPIEELHAFAERLGMRRTWFQPHPKMDHYDLTPRRRAVALAHGAVFVEARAQTIARRARHTASAAAQEGT